VSVRERRGRTGPRIRPAAHPLWYKDAILYELHVRAYADSNADGIGDFAGLAEKMDYLQDLGITAIWLLPFYPSPLKDDGYDTADYTNVHPSYGSLDDFRHFLDEAHRRGLRVITELVLNHTSDQHPWFQRARRAKAGSPERDFYVWSDSADRYPEVRIIFQDFEHSNWSWDHAAGAYYWHRFFAHQPDLNWDNPAVEEAMKGVLDFWFGEVGVDGLRLDAVPYLYEREGTNCENLPETHQALKRIRKYVDDKYGDRMLLAEANQWPEDSVAYFGEGAGDECHTAFHFPLMPRMFMAIRTEDRYPIVDMLEQTPAIPETAQWVLFLRNHDELTLEMVTDEERDYMYRVYAQDPRARINLGIRRRLAPLLGNSRSKIQLMNGLLLSLPGTPVIYYGDELGMGDNIYLGDRNGVRTPMQWSSDRNAGFSRANSQQLYFPVITDPEYHYEALNVEVQQNSTESLLWWTKRILSIRKRHRAFGRGTFEFLYPDNSKVLAYLRTFDGERILVIANLSRHAQHVELDLPALQGAVPVEMFGQSEFPAIAEGRPYPLALGPHQFYWFLLREPSAGAVATATAQPDLAPLLPLRFEDLTDPEAWPQLATVLPPYLQVRPWFGVRPRRLQTCTVVEILPLSADTVLCIARLEYTEGEPEIYALPLACASRAAETAVRDRAPGSVIARLTPSEQGEAALLYDAAYDPSFAEVLLDAILRPRTARGVQGEVRAWSSAEVRADAAAASGSTTVHDGRSHTLLMPGGRYVIKVVRQLHEGVNPGFEIGRFLTERRPFPHTPQVEGSLEYRRGGDRSMPFAILQRFVPNEGNAWQLTQDTLGRYFERVLAGAGEPPEAALDDIVDAAQAPLPQLASERLGTYVAQATLLGERTAELHAALASDPEDPAFAAEPFSTLYARSLVQSMRNLVRQVFQRLRVHARSKGAAAAPEVARVLDMEPLLLERSRDVFGRRLTGSRIRCHGDYHLGNVLWTGRDFVIINFEGDPSRSLGERRIKRSPLRDVAAMVRSFQYAGHEALLRALQGGVIAADKRAPLEAWVRYWERWASVAFLQGYLRTARSGLNLGSPEETKALLAAYLVEKAVHELDHELRYRPDWIRIPLMGLLAMR
jgi:maltose alpha-D-glucosyltransferase/alpha-amylase